MRDSKHLVFFLTAGSVRFWKTPENSKVTNVLRRLHPEKVQWEVRNEKRRWLRHSEVGTTQERHHTPFCIIANARSEDLTKIDYFPLPRCCQCRQGCKTTMDMSKFLCVQRIMESSSAQCCTCVSSAVQKALQQTSSCRTTCACIN